MARSRLQVFYINLDRRADRKAIFEDLIANRAPRTFAAIERVQGVDGKTLGPAELEAVCSLRKRTPPYFDAPALAKMRRQDGQECTVLALPGRKWAYSTRVLTPGAVGCALSHLACWERAAAHPDPDGVTICFEDDCADLATDFDSKLDELLGDLNQSNSVGGVQGWDLCYLGHYPRPPGAGPSTHPPDEAAVRGGQAARRVGGRGVYGLFGYALSRRGARRLLKWETRGRSPCAVLPLSAQIDVAVAERAGKGLGLFAAVPPLVLCDFEQVTRDTDVQLVHFGEARI